METKELQDKYKEFDDRITEQELQLKELYQDEKIVRKNINRCIRKINDIRDQKYKAKLKDNVLTYKDILHSTVDDDMAHIDHQREFLAKLNLYRCGFSDKTNQVLLQIFLTVNPKKIVRNLFKILKDLEPTFKGKTIGKCIEISLSHVNWDETRCLFINPYTRKFYIYNVPRYYLKYQKYPSITGDLVDLETVLFQLKKEADNAN